MPKNDKADTIEMQLAQWRIPVDPEIDDWDAKLARIIPVLKKLPEKLRNIGYAAFELNARGEKAELFSYRNDDETDKRIEEDRKFLIKWRPEIDKLSVADRSKIFAALGKELAPTIEAAWQYLKSTPYQGCFRAPKNPSISLENRVRWLNQLASAIAEFQPEVVTVPWMIGWGGKAFGWNADCVVPLAVAAMNGKSKLGDEVYEELRKIVTREHSVATMSSYVIQALLESNRESGWELVEKTLLAAQRQEGLRQIIVQNSATAHPDAFVRILRLIVDQDLIRFSSVARSVDVWLRLMWDSASTKVLKENVEAVLSFLESPAKRKEAMSSTDPETVYRALWCYAFEDAEQAVTHAKKLLQNSNEEIRYVAVWLLTLLGIDSAQKLKANAIDDGNLQVAVLAACDLSGLDGDSEVLEELEVDSGIDFESDDKNYFERLEGLYLRLPEKAETLKAMVWPWTERKIKRSDIAGLLFHHLGARPPTRMLPYMKGLDSWQQASLVEALAAQKKWDKLTRSTLLELAGHASPDVRKAVFNSLAKQKLNEAECIALEGYLNRTAADLRNGVVSLLRGQDDRAALASAKRLLQAKEGPRRLAGLELLRQLATENRSRKSCQTLAVEYQSTQKKLSKDETLQLKEIADSDREILTIETGFGLLDPAGRTKIVTPKKKKVTLITKGAIECIKSLDELIHEHRNTALKKRSWRGIWEEELLGEAGFLGHIDPKKPLEKQQAAFPLWELWETWKKKRPANLRDKDGLELLRALAACSFMFHYNYREVESFVKKAENRKLAMTVVGEIDAPKNIRYESTIESILRALFYSEIPKGCVDYLLDCYENIMANIPEAMMKKLLAPPDPTKERYPWERDENDWRSNELFSVWSNKLDRFCSDTGIKQSDAQIRRRYELNCFWDEPIAGAKRQRVDFSDLALAYRKKYASYDDLVDSLVGPGREQYRGFDDLVALCERHPSRQHREILEETKGLSELVEKIRSIVLETELNRGEKATSSTEISLKIKYVGLPTLFRLLAALNGKFKKLTGWSAKPEDSRIATLTEMVQATYPADDGTDADFVKLAKQAIADGYLSEDQLLELAFLAPQWSKSVGAILKWDGFSEGLYWFLAHMQTWYGDVTQAAASAEGLVDDSQDDDEQTDEADDFNDENDASSESEEPKRKLTAWERLILERTPLTVQQRSEGAVDVDWFLRTYKQLGDKRWQRMAECAKLAANSSQAKKAQFLADVLLGKTPRKELVDGIKKRNLKEYVRLLGLLPLATGAKRQADILERYQVLLSYKKYARGLSSLTKPEAMRSLEIGMSNLARLAGYADPLRLEWALEAQSLSDLAKGPVSVTKEGVTVTLELDAEAKPVMTVTKGGKPLRAVPAPLRKKHTALAELSERATELRKQTSRMKQSLEVAMCRGDFIDATELLQLMQHPILAPQLKRLVLVGEGIAGYPDKDGRVLRDHAGKLEPIKKQERLRIAHSSDLFKRGDWDKWQHECFQAELVQPFKQVFRELYVPTKQEKGAVESKRFSGQQIGPKQAMALWNGRGWNTQEGVFKIFHELSLIVDVSFQYDVGTAAEVEGLTVESVSFRQRDSYKPLKLADVPLVVFSEVMRDMDLVVSVAHRGEVDPEASESTVEMRASLIRETCQLLGLKNVKFKSTHAIIDGYYGEYTLHLGSGGIHKRPGGALAVLPVHAQHRGRLFLPFADNDPKTAEIVSKVLLLAKDDEIMDPTILDQLGAPVKKRPAAAIQAAANEAANKAKKVTSGKEAAGDSSQPSGSTATNGAGRRRFEFSDGSSNKFWEIELAGTSVITTWGRIGSSGQSKSKEFATEAKAQTEYDKLVREKTSKGYMEK